MFDKIVFAKRLVAVRTNRGIMAKDVALALGVSKAAISQLESGVNTPTANTLCALADYFDISVDYLAGRSDEAVRR